MTGGYKHNRWHLLSLKIGLFTAYQEVFPPRYAGRCLLDDYQACAPILLLNGSIFQADVQAESFNAELERIKHGVFHYLSKKHLQRYVSEVAFRWNHRRSVLKENGKTKMEVLPFAKKLWSLLSLASWRQLRRTAIGVSLPVRFLSDFFTSCDF